jgi:hypothetical protein
MKTLQIFVAAMRKKRWYLIIFCGRENSSVGEKIVLYERK